MEEKKLTDEEVARAILQSIEYSKTITYFDEWGNCKSIMVTDILNLIHRLQSENEGLKERGQTLIDSLHKTIAEQKAEIERLARESDEMFDRHAKENQAASLLIEKRNDEIAELQKQVDEYKAKIEQGTLIELPCKVGDTVWELDLYSKQKIREIKARTLLQIFHWIDNEAFGDYLFLTREEAEKRLKELQG